ncbi:MAG: hypothetical protein B6I31_05330 [Desulfobacteraceae bacterium 4572_19]|nr:MAG: hypothetical protein B6I31_05330 [Desulfobacteraceae bacterium 4572_19]
MKSGSFTYFTKRAVADFKSNRFLHIITTTTIAFSILIISAFLLFFINTGNLITFWEDSIRVIVFLDDNVSQTQIKQLEQTLTTTTGVDETFFIHRDEALIILKNQLKGQLSIIEDLKENPLPHSLEVSLLPFVRNLQDIKKLAQIIKKQDGVKSVEYGYNQLDKFLSIFNLFRCAVIGISTLFFIAMTLITANTIRLTLYSRQQEIEIMHLVGATDSFIKYPFYIASMIEGAIGSIIGLISLFTIFYVVILYIEQFSAYADSIKFLSVTMCFIIILCSTFIGWIGCYLSLRQFLK